MNESETLREWLRGEIAALLARDVSPPPLVLWCDPERAWPGLLMAAADGAPFELCCEDEHELILRERLLAAPPAPRVVWLPVGREGITYLKVFELQADHVWTEPLGVALARFGVEIPREYDPELRDALRSYAREWIDRPRSDWRDMTPSGARSALVDEDQILLALARVRSPVAEVIGEDRLDILCRRLTEDFGLPSPTPGRDDEWREAATARLLVTEAAVRIPAEPPRDGDRIVPAGAARDRALKLLDRWLKHVELMAAFEDLSRRADRLTSLPHWARHQAGDPPPLASPGAEEALFEKEVEHLAGLEDFEPLARRLEARGPFYSTHAGGFWGLRAERKVAWERLVAFARAATLLRGQAGAEGQWKSPGEAVSWFTTAGWEVDRQAEILFRDDPFLPGALHGVRSRLRRAYLRHLDRCNAAFSELLSHPGPDVLGLPFAGEVLAEVRQSRDPTAVLVLDACRFDLGSRLAEALNKGEPARRAEVRAARSPLPSITDLGMAFALADEPAALSVAMVGDSSPRWRVTAGDGAQDLATAEGRREWLRRRFKLRPSALTDVKAVLGSTPPSPRESGRLLFVFGDELDKQGHEGELEFTGADQYVDRYVRAIHRLRDAGYPTVVVVTDHGFFHWEPEEDEKDDPPTGEVAWKGRRAAAGRNLGHPTAVSVRVPGSDLECRVPRSVNAFRAYGKMGYFHGGATLQELVIPVIVCRWPRKAEKVPVVLSRMTAITSIRPRVEVGPGATGQLPGLETDPKRTGRQVTVKVVEPRTGRRLFRSAEIIRIEPGGVPTTVVLEREARETCARGARVQIEVRDADNDELLDTCEVELAVDLEEWD